MADIRTVKAGTTDAPMSGVRIYGFRVHQAPSGSTFAPDDSALQRPISLLGDYRPDDWKKGAHWRKVSFTAPASGDILVELATTPGEEFGHLGWPTQPLLRAKTRTVLCNGVGFTNGVAGSVAAAIVTLLDSWVGGKLLFVSRDGAAGHTWQKFTKDNANAWQRSGQFATDPATDQTWVMDIPLSGALYIACDVAGPIAADLFLEQP